VQADVAAVLSRDAPGQVETKAEPLPHFLGREEGLEDLRPDRFCYPGSIVRDFNRYALAL